MEQAATAGLWPQFTITDKLRKARSIAGLTAVELGERIGVDKSTVSNYENPSWERGRKVFVLRQWALACGVDPAWIDPQLGPDGPKRGAIRPESTCA